MRCVVHLYQRARQPRIGQSGHHSGTQCLVVEEMPEQQDDQQLEQSIKHCLPPTMSSCRFDEQPSEGIGQQWQLIQGQHQKVG
ncbi:hypothetical protein FQZ97_890200 [compost metagenome]